MTEGYFALDARPLWKRIAWRLFPFTPAPMPSDDDPRFVPGYCMTVSIIQFDLLDRLRVLATGRVRVETRIKTDKVVECMESHAGVTVLPPFDRELG